jgi:hypothetical protein
MSRVTVYQDGSSLPVQRIAAAFGATLFRLPPSPPPAPAASAAQPSSPSSFSPVSNSRHNDVLFNRLTDNYAAMLLHAFDVAAASDVIVLEEDLEVSPDFSLFFSGAISLLHKHTDSFFCASSYNDNAFAGIALDNSALRIGEHFMALGWAITRTQFDKHIRHKWRVGDIWDAPFVKAVMNGAGPCIFPEVARSKHHSDPDFAQDALTTSAVFQRVVLDQIQLAPAPHTAQNASFNWDNVLPSTYSARLLRRIANSVPVRFHRAALSL